MTSAVQHLNGRTLESASFDVDTKEWVFAFAGGVALRVAAPWRVVRHGAISLGWEDDAQPFGLPSPIDATSRLEELFGGRCVDCAMLGACGDLTIAFEESGRLEIFNASCGYEGWQLYGPGDQMVVAQGGGNVVYGVYKME